MVFLEFFESILSSFYFILSATSLSFLLKLAILVVLFRKAMKAAHLEKPLSFLSLVLIGNMFSDLAWMLKLSQILFLPQISYKIVLFVIRIAWIFFLVQYQSISLLIESLIIKHYRVSLRHKLLFIVNALFGIFFLAVAIIDFDCVDRIYRKFWFEPKVQNAVTFYALFFVVMPSIFFVIKNINTFSLPRLLRKQLNVLMQGLVLPILL